MKYRISRRGFLANTALAGTSLLILDNSSSVRSYQANEKLDIALIGVGGRGRWFVGTMPKLDTNVVAMCDVNERKASLSFDEIPEAKKYFDYRRMLEEMDNQIDADSHAIRSPRAARAGGEMQSRNADGKPGHRQRGLPPGGRACAGRGNR
jgi:hypothetical protein